jgi:hypothetical protein
MAITATNNYKTYQGMESQDVAYIFTVTTNNYVEHRIQNKYCGGSEVQRKWKLQ